MNCGYVLSAPEPALEAEAAPNLCPNPACAVANLASEHVCQRCGSPLPIAPGTVLHGGYRIEGLLAQIKLSIGGQHITSIITSDAAREMQLKRGDKAAALVKSTEVMIVRV